jgi:hypothetical protein
MMARTLVGILAASLFVAALPISGAPVAAQRPGLSADTVDVLARDVSRLESLRAVKDVQRLYAQYAQFGLWSDMADLFGAHGRILWGDREITGRAAILAWLEERGGPAGLAPGALNTLLTENSLVNLSADGTTAKGRWAHMALTGDGKGKTGIEGGIFENDYVREGGRWKIATLHYYPQYEGTYADGASNVGQKDLPIVPFHFLPDTVGVPIAPAVGMPPKSGASLASLGVRIAAMNAEDDVRNLQHAYGYYVQRKMWDDVIDLFAQDGVIEIAGVGTFKGPEGVRKALERMGPAGLVHGEVNDRLVFDAIVKVAPGASEAFARGTELGMLGQADKGEAGWEISVFRNRFVREDGLWKIREMRIQPLMTADYKSGWGNGGIGGPKRPALPAFLGPNPATDSPVALAGQKPFAAQPLTGAIRPGVPAASGLTDLRRRALRSLAYDGTENVSAAYGYYLDDSQWAEMARIFAIKGNKQSPFAGYYFGRERIAAAATAMYGPAKDPKTMMRPGVAFHWRIEPVILVSHDGRSTTLRTYLFHPNTGKYDKASGKPNRAGTIQTGMYPNDQVVLEDGVWRMWSLTIDEPYFVMPNWQEGWSGAKEPPAGERPSASPLMQRYPPDIPITDLGRREEGFRGGVGTTVTWPGIVPMWFDYRNPVSGREPASYWPDCVPCEKRPEASMTRNGYSLPPRGPQIDGVEVGGGNR